MRPFDRFMTEAEERQLFRTVKSRSGLIAERDLSWMKLLRLTGMRIGTLAGFTCEDARLALKTERLVFRDEICKGGHGYDILATKQVRVELMRLLTLRRKQGHIERADEPLVMSRQQGKGLSVRSFQSRLTYWRKEAELNIKITPHWFRHTFAKRIGDRTTSGDPLGMVQAALNHSTPYTSQIYFRPDRTDVDQSIRGAAI